MITTRNTEKMGRTARQMAENQRDSYEAFTENLTAAQRRSIGLANGGLEFLRLQKDNTRAAQEWFANGVSLLERQRRNTEFAQGWMGDAVEAVREQTEHNVRTAEAFARGVSKQQEGLRALSQGWVRPIRRAKLHLKSWKPLLRRAGVPDLRFHDLRHTCATLLLAKGVHPKIVSEMLGHLSIAITLDTYGHMIRG